MQELDPVASAVPVSAIQTSTRTQQRSIRDFFISPPALPSAKRLKTQAQVLAASCAPHETPHPKAAVGSTAVPDSVAQCLSSHGPVAWHSADEGSTAEEMSRAGQQENAQPEFVQPKQGAVVAQQQHSHVQIQSSPAEAAFDHVQLQPSYAHQAHVHASCTNAVQYAVTLHGQVVLSGAIAASKIGESCQPAQAFVHGKEQLASSLSCGVRDDDGEKENVCHSATARNTVS